MPFGIRKHPPWGPKPWASKDPMLILQRNRNQFYKKSKSVDTNKEGGSAVSS